MISSIASHGVQQLHSTPAVNIAHHANLSGQAKEKEDEGQQQSPVPVDSHKIKAAVTTQEGQASKKEPDNKDSQAETKTKPDIGKSHSTIELDEEELKEVQELKQRDIEVRAHEAAHLAAAGQYAQGGANFTLQRGPDGRSYAIGGSVNIDTSAEADPDATLRKAEQIQRAALAPAEPSGQDRSVAAQAAKMKLAARAEIQQEQRSESKEASEAGGTTQTTKSPNELKASDASSEIEKTDSTAKILCDICSGDHPTGPHLEANQRKTNEYLAVSQA